MSGSYAEGTWSKGFEEVVVWCVGAGCGVKKVEMRVGASRSSIEDVGIRGSVHCSRWTVMAAPHSYCFGLVNLLDMF